MSMLTGVDDALRRARLENSRLVVGVSGGPDSLALLLILADLREHLRLGLLVAHFDHQLRPESAADADFVRSIAGTLGVDCEVGSADVRMAARNERIGLEAAARRSRYRFFSQVSAASGAAAVAVGHTSDDQVETRLLHLVRGAGLRGLVGMAEDISLTVPGAAPLRLIRPRLGFDHQASLEVCQAHGVEPRQDPTNLDPAFRRNRLRHEVVPVLRSLNPRFDLALARLGQIAIDAEAFLAHDLARQLPGLAARDDEGWRIERGGFRALAAAQRRVLVQHVLADLAADDSELGLEQVDRVTRTIARGRTGSRLQLPGRRELVVEVDAAVIRATRVPPPPFAAIPLAIDRVSSHPLRPPRSLRRESLTDLECDVLLEIAPRGIGPTIAPAMGPWQLDLDLDRLPAGCDLVLRPRRSGDWLAPEGLDGRKKLQDLFVDAGIPRSERDLVPIVAANDAVVWVVGLRRDRRFLAQPESRRVLGFRVRPSVR